MIIVDEAAYAATSQSCGAGANGVGLRVGNDAGLAVRHLLVVLKRSFLLRQAT